MTCKVCWLSGSVLFSILIICSAGPLQGFNSYESRKEKLNSQTPGVSSNDNPVERTDPGTNAIKLSLSYACRNRRNIVEDAKETVKSTTDKLSWVKKNFRYLFLMAGSIFLLLFSCVAYRRLTRDTQDDDGDKVKVVVIRTPKEKLSPADTKTSSNLPNSAKKEGTNKNTKKPANTNKTAPKKSSRPSTKTPKKR